MDTTPQAGTTRLHHLDSLRGVAAVAVALDHSLFSFPDVPCAGFLSSLLAGAPVDFFFLLSGFVLGRSLDKSRGLTPVEISGFYLRRVFRLYPALLAALIFSALAAKFYIIPAEWSPASAFLRRVMTEAHYDIATIHDYVNSLTLKNIKLDPPLWTIRVEFLCSFLLPFLVLLTKRIHRLTVPLLLGLALFKILGRGDPTNLLAFYLGALIHYAAPALAALSVRQTKWLLYLGVVVLLFGMSTTLNPVSENLLLAGLLAVLVPCHWPGLKKFLVSRPLLFLGRISYSFYLLHLPVLLLTWTLLGRFSPGLLCYSPRIVPVLALFLISLAITFPLAHFCQRFVEVPFNNLGHRVVVPFWSLHLGKILFRQGVCKKDVLER